MRVSGVNLFHSANLSFQNIWVIIMNRSLFNQTLILGIGLWSCSAYSANLTIPNTFTAGTTAVASQVNANFSAVKVAVDDNNTNIANLQNLISTLQTTISTMQSQITDLQNRVQTLENDSVTNLGSYMSIDTSSGYATVVFNGVNLQVKNGATESIANGLGNIIIGYNADLTSTLVPEVCSDSQYNNSTDCLANSKTWSRNHKSGSHNLIISSSNSYSSTGGIIAGTNNIVTGQGSTITGGTLNVVTGDYTSIMGGTGNLASGDASAMVGGKDNIGAADYSTLAGGRDNDAVGCNLVSECGYVTITGGQLNTTGGPYATVSGGYNNNASGTYSVVNGGRNNDVQTGNTGSTISGGNTVTVTSGESADTWKAGALVTP